MPNSYYYSNTAQATTLSGSISSGATSIQVAATTGFPTSYPYVLALDYGAAAEELVSVSSAAGTTLTVVRGFGSTSAQSHSLGAAVRHTYNAVDATDFRTHEAATGAVHGLSGSIVGTTDVQTLTNKTLSAPAISNPTVTGGGSLAGTFSGSPTLSGVPVFSGGATFTGAVSLTNNLTSTRSTAATAAMQTLVTADTFDRWRVYADGKQEWGPGNAARDSTLVREGVGALATTDTLLRVYRTSTSSDTFSSRITGDTQSRWRVQGDGSLNWGPGGATVTDTNLYRNGVGILKTDTDLQVAGNLSAANFSTGAWTSYTPTLTASTGTNPTLGNSTLTGLWYRTGRMINVFVRLLIGSTFVPGNGAGSENWLFALPVAPAAGWDGFRVFSADMSDVSAAQHWGGTGAVDTASSGRISTLVANDHTTTAVWDSSAPISINTGDILTIWGAYESAS